MKTKDRVKLINPGGYDNYQGTLDKEYLPGWWYIKWDMPVHPCTSPMEEKHLILVDN